MNKLNVKAASKAEIDYGRRLHFLKNEIVNLSYLQAV